MKKFIKFIKNSIKLSIGLYFLIFVFVFTAMYLWVNFNKNKNLEIRLKKLEAVNDSLSITPDQHFTIAKAKIKQGNLDEAISILHNIENRFPQWKPALVSNSIREIKNAKKNIETDKNKLLSGLENINDKVYEKVTNSNTNEANHISQPVFKKFEYEDRKVFPLRTSNTGHKKKVKHHDSKSNSISNKLKIDKKDSKKGFEKYEYVDDRYKKNTPPVKAKKIIPTKTKVKVIRKKDTTKKTFEYEDTRYKVNKKSKK